MPLFESGYSELPRSITPKFNIPGTPGQEFPDPASIISPSRASDVITRHPLCDKNLLKDIDGLASLASMPSLPNLEQLLSAGGLPNLGKMDPKSMFTGVPEFTGLVDIPGLPDKIDFKKEAKALADDLLHKLDISNPLDDLCAKVQGAGADLQEELGKIELTPNINAQMPNIDIPKFTDLF